MYWAFLNWVRGDLKSHRRDIPAEFEISDPKQVNIQKYPKK